MLSTGPTTLALASLFAAFPTAIATTEDSPSAWLQFGLGGLALFILFMVLKPLVKALTSTIERMARSIETSATAQAANVEIQRGLLRHAEQAALADAALAQAIQDLSERIPARG